MQTSLSLCHCVGNMNASCKGFYTEDVSGIPANYLAALAAWIALTRSS